MPPHVVVARSWPDAAAIAQPQKLADQLMPDRSAQQIVSPVADGRRVAFHARPPLAIPFEAPLGTVERVVSDVWRAVLGIEQVGRNDDLTELGGDSLIAIQIIARLRETFKINLTVRSIFEEATVAAVAKHIETLRWHAAGPPQEALALDEDEGTL